MRLHSGIAYVTPQARLEGRDQEILAERRRKLIAARLAREVTPRPVPAGEPCDSLALAVA